MIYLDNSATTRPYKEVIDSFVKVSTDYFGNPSSLHQLGVQAENLLSKGRKQLADLLGVKPGEVFFTSGGTESNNLAIKGAAIKHRGRGNHIITTEVEHASVRETMNQLKQLGFEITYLPVNSEGRMNIDDLEKAISRDTILVTVMHVNNEVGTIQPVEEVGKFLQKYPRVLFHVDYVQGAGKIPLDLKRHHIDLCSISGHKFHGLKGTGLLYVRDGVQISPLLTGGSQEFTIRSGTENVAGAVAMAKALRLTMEKQRSDSGRLVSMKEQMIQGLMELSDVTIHTPSVHSAPHIINFSIKGFKAEVFVHALEEKGVYVSTTSACSSKKKSTSTTLLAMGVDEGLANSSVRISLSYENRMEEINQALTIIKETVKNLKEVMK
ncbi:cysteine desulfurase family protein [Bacillus dakarensis]|uniref:cysteine desulfurase family protein n=1 Tax=Robertmurraya dakarensis TaxID=1926278 RepID=UPI000980AF83|nr:cysteine desulfurase family protein [Bacillus dakarensis]